MSKLSLTWNDLSVNAQKYHLDADRFSQLAPFFDSLKAGDLERFASELPMSEVTYERLIQIYPEGHGAEQMLLLCILANADRQQELYEENNWPLSMCEEIRWDLKTWTDSLLRDFDGKYGLTYRIYIWEAHCLLGIVKSFGRLQCNDIHQFTIEKSIYRQSDGTIKLLPFFQAGNPRHPDLTWGDKTINCHIPAIGPLKFAECQNSIRRMLDFSAKYHPDYDVKAVVCYSWVLDPVFKELLPETANIVQFQSLGHTVPMPEIDQTEEVVWRIWGNAGLKVPYDSLPRQTTMEKKVSDYLVQGGKFCEGLMVHFMDEKF